ncbi:MAG: aromatic aminobenezylarsenical efflux permease ArsG family transporter [Thermoguttaceae bacterium]|nr:aromatic aminobenezylarsenical efflux permease ArsG family transporter [Thermoguttaceae bacterium]MDW8036594.1 aromatic aminobenezylarsenical efflux permease ArsG family transporter [Thermoguttaceae bacterium]
MGAYGVALAAAVYLGLLTSISPCPLATNIAAISYVGRRVGSPGAVLWAGLLYTLGRAVVYLLLAVALTSMALSMSGLSLLLQKSVHLVLGPILILLGMLLLGLITSTGGGSLLGEKWQRRIDQMGLWGAFAMGVVFALSFCPTSAAWFFGLVALVLGSASGAAAVALEKIGLSFPETPLPAASLVLPLVYGVATAAPVVLMAALLAYAAHWVGKAYNMLGVVERVVRLATGWIFILLGLYFTFVYVFEISA